MRMLKYTLAVALVSGCSYTAIEGPSMPSRNESVEASQHFWPWLEELQSVDEAKLPQIKEAADSESTRHFWPWLDELQNADNVAAAAER